ncbi:hypothetical protein EVAR_31882_1 [Eumeta japonica]|uniref:Uncharacterized protein n=1 Tax=Eumeta variegata TaxID=151549 RepID=A0A4C1WXH3_EUMVA|nr:hypothetical protein EVAR_31882_1 [Eumeta japonica]
MMFPLKFASPGEASDADGRIMVDAEKKLNRSRKEIARQGHFVFDERHREQLNVLVEKKKSYATPILIFPT